MSRYIAAFLAGVVSASVAIVAACLIVARREGRL